MNIRPCPVVSTCYDRPCLLHVYMLRSSTSCVEVTSHSHVAAGTRLGFRDEDALLGNLLTTAHSPGHPVWPAEDTLTWLLRWFQGGGSWGIIEYASCVWREVNRERRSLIQRRKMRKQKRGPPALYAVGTPGAQLQPEA